MEEELKTEPVSDMGQSEIGSDGNQTTDAGPQDETGQSVEDQTTHQGTDEDSFFDPRDIADQPELTAAYKNMQRAYTKKMQAIADQRQKIDAYDAFYQNPIEQIQRVAQQYGYQLSPAQAQQVANQQTTETQSNEPWQPQSWDEVMSKATEIAEQRILQKMDPVLSQVQNMRKESIESQLAEIDPAWHQYEDEMRDTIKTHPTLANDPAKLYRLSVPTEVLESRATQAALRKLEARQQSGKVSGKSTTTKEPGGGLPDKPVSFSEAVAAAKKNLADQGIRPG